jgi:peptidoglycan/xylan/chitin deacetylase (PgdA/CDA1 family)
MTPILAYHNINRDFEWGINTVSPKTFEKQISYLAENGYRTIKLSEYINDQIIPDKPMIITFDDAYKSIHKYAFPILKQYNYTATLFVITEYVGKKNLWDNNLGGKTQEHLSWSDIEYLSSAGWEIGSHTATHPDLTRLIYDDCYDELASSKKRLERQLGIRTAFLSYPFNRYNQSVIEIARMAGYRGGCCLAPDRRIPDEDADFVISRRGVYSIDRFLGIRSKLSNGTLGKIEDARQRVISAFSKGTIYYKQVKKGLQF